MILIDVIGWLGMALLLTAFYLASSKHIRDTRCPYHFLNLTGAMAVLVNALAQHVWAMAAVEAVWSGIALVGLWKTFMNHRRANALE